MSYSDEATTELEACNNDLKDIECIRMHEPRLFDYSRAATMEYFSTLGLVMMFTSLSITIFYLLKKAPLVV